MSDRPNLHVLRVFECYVNVLIMALSVSRKRVSNTSLRSVTLQVHGFVTEP